MDEPPTEPNAAELPVSGDSGAVGPQDAPVEASRVRPLEDSEDVEEPPRKRLRPTTDEGSTDEPATLAAAGSEGSAKGGDASAAKTDGGDKMDVDQVEGADEKVGGAENGGTGDKQVEGEQGGGDEVGDGSGGGDDDKGAEADSQVDKSGGGGGNEAEAKDEAGGDAPVEPVRTRRMTRSAAATADAGAQDEGSSVEGTPSGSVRVTRNAAALEETPSAPAEIISSERRVLRQLRFITQSTFCEGCATQLWFPQDALQVQCPKCSRTIDPRLKTTTECFNPSCKELLSHPQTAQFVQCPKCMSLFNPTDTARKQFFSPTMDVKIPASDPKEINAKAFRIFCKSYWTQVSLQHPGITAEKLTEQLRKLWAQLPPAYIKSYEQAAGSAASPIVNLYTALATPPLGNPNSQPDANAAAERLRKVQFMATQAATTHNAALQQLQSIVQTLQGMDRATTPAATIQHYTNMHTQVYQRIQASSAQYKTYMAQLNALQQQIVASAQGQPAQAQASQGQSTQGQQAQSGDQGLPAQVQKSQQSETQEGGQAEQGQEGKDQVEQTAVQEAPQAALQAAAQPQSPSTPQRLQSIKADSQQQRITTIVSSAPQG